MLVQVTIPQVSFLGEKTQKKVELLQGFEPTALNLGSSELNGRFILFPWFVESLSGGSSSGLENHWYLSAKPKCIRQVEKAHMASFSVLSSQYH